MIGKSHVIASNAQHFDALRWIAHLFGGTQAFLCFLPVVTHGSAHPQNSKQRKERTTGLSRRSRGQRVTLIKFCGVLRWRLDWNGVASTLEVGRADKSRPHRAAAMNVKRLISALANV
jgi:hypothetical protein